ncbi:Cyclic di-GMP phosphodiesterase response regulator RpfG [Fundidesulfovibrio magnetotacticus]|uniref:Cyclic di-GMP phosphodiesterase response regulator RpfG n=1 Tax=Fundidesulfovibrio magnetotacticus TaxID=2730080 RepID=A0A6V8LQ12_9BACT|nr:HD-GYP domain-containing protein [Fundidesulfovibrio magnetotacticus]GFK94613.1 Cyclic di-GMP phosphodiesterase response regulator RpfG [Fundidesulfovibrio magnetotacticus]
MSALKRIPLEKLRPGMFVHGFELSWFKHPYLTTRIGLLRDADRIEELRALGVPGVQIDVTRGLDVEPDPQPEPCAPAEEAPACRDALAEVPPQWDTGQTLRYARRLFVQSMESTRRFLAQAEAGQDLNMDEASRIVGVMVETAKSNRSVLRLLSVLKSYDDYTYTHSLNVAALGVLFGQDLGLGEDKLRILGLSGLLHDVGKCLIPREILTKPQSLTPAEFEVMKRHTVLGWRYVQDQGQIPGVVAEAVLDHHERQDGTGYPRNLKGNGIPGLPRILSVLDVYDALTSDRVYRAGLSPHAALRTIYTEMNASLPRDLLMRFVRCVGVYPPGTVVQLKNGFYAVVTGSNPRQPLHPPMTLFLGPDRKPVRPRRVETVRLGTGSSGSGYEIARTVEPSEVQPPGSDIWL